MALGLAVLAGLGGCGDRDADRTQAAPAPAPAAAAAPSSSDSAAEQSELARLLAEPDYYRRVSNLAAFLERADREGSAARPELIREIRAAVESFRVDESVAEFGLLFRFWAEHDPAAAATWSLTPGVARYQLGAVYTAFEAWARKNPEEAVLGVQPAAVEKEHVSRTAQMALIHGWFERDRDQLLEYIRDQGIGIERQRAIFGYVLSLASKEGPAAAQAWAESLPDDDERFKLAAFRQTMNALSTIDLAEAVKWCDQHCDSRWGASLRKPIMRTRLRKGDPPPEVLAWLSRMPKETKEQQDERMLSLQLAYATWSTTRKEEAMAWFESIVDTPEEPEWLPLLDRYHGSLIASEDPRRAIAFVERRIAEGPERERALIAVGQMWKSHDPNGLQAWLENSPLSEQARLQVIRYQRPQ